MSQRKPIFDKDIPVVVFRRNLPGLRMRMLSDRDVGQIIWELTYLDDAGNVLEKEERRMRPVELIHIDEVLGALKEAIDALTPRRRLDCVRLQPPVAVSQGDV